MPKKVPAELKRDVVAAVGLNAPTESVHSLLLTKNVLNRRRRATRSELHNAIVTWIEHTYNRRRRKACARQAYARRVRTRLHPS